MDDLIRVADRLYLINSTTNGKFPMAFSFLVKGTDTHALIDTGCGEAVCRAVREEHGVDVVINSHCHPDHISGNHLFEGKDLWVPQERSAETGTLENLARRLVGPDPQIINSWLTFARRDLGMRDYHHTKTFQDEERFDFGGITLQAIHTPGHLADHYCFLEPCSNCLLSFDVDLTTFGPFYGNPEADIPAFRRTLKKIKALSPATIASSHRRPVGEQVMEELQDFTAKIDRNGKRVLSVLDQPRILDEICLSKPIFGKYIPGLEVMYTFFERHMVEKHLDEMVKNGQVAFRDGCYSRC